MGSRFTKFEILRASGIRCRLLLCWIAAICGLSIIVTAQPAEPAAATANDSAKHLLFEFFSYNTMDSKIVRDLIINSGPASEVIKDDYQLIVIEQGSDPEKETLYKIIHYPTLVIAQPDGAEIERIVGFQRPDEVAATLKAALDGQSEMGRIRKQASAPDAGIRDHVILASALRQRGDLEGSFQECLWTLDNGKRIEPGSYPTMFPLIIQQLVFLAKKYPPAVDELKKRQTAIKNAAEAEKAAPEAIEQAFVINEALDQASLNVPLYLKIPADDPLKQSLFLRVFPELVRAGKYKEAAGVADLEYIVNLMYPRFNGKHARGPNDEHGHDVAESASLIKRRIAAYASAACEALVALGQVEKAKRVAGRAIDYLGGDNRAFVARLDAITSQSSAQAGEFLAWLKSYLRTSEPESS